jgi:hypothetical protein
MFTVTHGESPFTEPSKSGPYGHGARKSCGIWNGFGLWCGDVCAWGLNLFSCGILPQKPKSTHTGVMGNLFALFGGRIFVLFRGEF